MTADWMILVRETEQETDKLPQLSKKRSPLLGNSAIYALCGFVAIIVVLAGFITFWCITSPVPPIVLSKPALSAITVFQAVQKNVGGLHATQAVAVFGPYKPGQDVAFADEKGNWFLIASFDDDRQAFDDQQSMKTSGYMAVSYGNCLMVFDKNNSNSTVLLEIIKEVQSV